MLMQLIIACIDESGGLNIQESNLLIPPYSGVYNFSIITPPGEGEGGLDDFWWFVGTNEKLASFSVNSANKTLKNA